MNIFLGFNHKNNALKKFGRRWHALCMLEIEPFISEVMLNTFLKTGKKGGHRGKCPPHG